VVYNVKSVIIDKMSDSDFIQMCDRNYRKTVKVCTLVTMPGLLSLLGVIACAIFLDTSPGASQHKQTVDLVANALLWFFCIYFAPFAFCGMYLVGNAAGEGILFRRARCENLNDWVKFADLALFVPKGTIISRQLMLENKTPLEISRDSREIRCRNATTDETEIFYLHDEKTFKEMFEIVEAPGLAENEIILDLSVATLVAYVGAKGSTN
jgi:hypothetical protein